MGGQGRQDMDMCFL